MQGEEVIYWFSLKGGPWPYQNSIVHKVQFSNIVFAPSAFIVLYAVIKQQTWEKLSLHIKKQSLLVNSRKMWLLPTDLLKVKEQIQPQ